ncbi:hypothetical protein J6590_056175 [Homalodisca vitripennis]|nr:hypothetical protein J6590_056175 [Homalodisca vitripennis]
MKLSSSYSRNLNQWGKAVDLSLFGAHPKLDIIFSACQSITQIPFFWRPPALADPDPAEPVAISDEVEVEDPAADDPDPEFGPDAGPGNETWPIPFRQLAICQLETGRKDSTP